MSKDSTSNYDELAVLFPKKTFPLDEKHSIEVKPLSLEDLPFVTDAFSRIAEMIGKGRSIPEITVSGMTELLKITKYCIDVPTKYIPMGVIPDLLTLIVEMNMNEKIVKKWLTLIELVNKELGQGEQQDSKKEKDLSQK